MIETLARNLSSGKYDIHVAVITSSHNNSTRLPPHIALHELNASRVRNSASKLLRLIWRIRPRIILSGMAHLNLLVLMLRPLVPARTHIIVRQNGALSATLTSFSQNPLSRVVYSAAYRHADHVICQTETMAQEIQRELRVPRRNLVVLPNPTDLHRIRELSSSAPARFSRTGFILLAIGRLVTEKGFDLLLNAFAALSTAHLSAELVIAGSGLQRSSLEQQVQALGIHNRVHFAGHTPDPIIHFGYASLYVLSSRTEGLPNAMLEAAAAGLPIVATPASPGLTEMLKDREGVWLAEDVSADSLRVALENALTVLRPGRRYPHKWIEQFDISRAIPAYEAAIDSTIAGNAH